MPLTYKMPPQVNRIVLLAIGIVGSYLVARVFLTPASFNEKGYGWYRKDALAEVATHDRAYAGKKACEECHAEEVKKVSLGIHKTLSCEGCHGPGEAHAGNPDNGDVKMQVLNFSHCVRCHEANPSRPKWHKQIVSKDHYAGTKCTECHVPHSPAEVP